MYQDKPLYTLVHLIRKTNIWYFPSLMDHQADDLEITQQANGKAGI